MTRLRAAYILVPLSVAACTGFIGGSDDERAGNDATRDGGGTASSSSCTTTAAPPTTRVRRLTKAELQSTLALVLGADAAAALANVDGDSQANGKFSNSDETTASSSFVNSLNVAAEQIGTAFKATVKSPAFAEPCFASDVAAEDCAKTFVQTVGAKLFRRTITDQDVSGLTTVYEAARELGTKGDPGDRFATGLSWIVKAMVQSPDFLYLTELGDPSVTNGATTTLLPEEMANAISYSVIGMPPDSDLMAAAAQNQLATPDQRRAQARRLIAAFPDKWKQQMRQFVQEWLGINFAKPDWAKSSADVPLFSAALRDGLQAETAMFIDDWATSPDGARLDELLTSSSTFVNEVTAPLYGVTASGTAFKRVALDPSQRAGILTSGGFLGSTSHIAYTSPVMRGKVIMQKFLCTDPPPPPPVVPPLPPPDSSAPTTTRQRFAQHLTDPACSGCHSRFQPIGDAFEGYDPIGQYRTQENGFPVDTSGALVGGSGGDKPVANALELIHLLAESPDTYACVARQTFRFTIGHREGDFDSCDLARTTTEWSRGNLDIQELILAIVSSDSFSVRTVRQ